MAFKPGHEKIPGSGMQKGQKISRSLDALKIAEEYDTNPIQFLFDVLTGKNPNANFDHQMAAAKELAPYLYAKLKSIEISDPGRDQAIKETLEAFLKAPK